MKQWEILAVLLAIVAVGVYLAVFALIELIMFLIEKSLGKEQMPLSFISWSEYSVFSIHTTEESNEILR